MMRWRTGEWRLRRHRRGCTILGCGCPSVGGCGYRHSRPRPLGAKRRVHHGFVLHHRRRAGQGHHESRLAASHALEDAVEALSQLTLATSAWRSAARRAVEEAERFAVMTRSDANAEDARNLVALGYAAIADYFKQGAATSRATSKHVTESLRGYKCGRSRW